MKIAIAIAAAGMAVVTTAMATPAAAFHLGPTGDFTADGNTSATKGGISLPCIAHFTGTVDSEGVGQVTGGSFTDNGGIGCTAVALKNLPWQTTAINAKKVKLFGVTFSSPIGDCGPTNIIAKLKRGRLSFNAVPMKGGCSVSAKVKTKPKLKILPN